MIHDRAILHRWRLRLDRWLLFVLVIVALGLRLYRLEQESLWLDEIGQALVAKSSWWLTILRSAQHYGNTPLDYLVTHLTFYIGQSEGVLRLPSVTWGGLSVIVIYLLGKEIFDKPTGYLSAFLLAVLPLHVYYSRELRFYSLATFLVLLSIYTFVRAVRRNSVSAWLLYGVVHLFALYSHYYVLIVTGVQGLWLLWSVLAERQERSSFWAFLLTAGLAVILFSPWLYYDFQYEQVRKQGLLNAPFTFTSPSTMGLLGSFFFLKPGPYMSFNKLSAWWVWLILGAVLVGFGISLLSRDRSHSSYYLPFLIFLPLTGLVSVLILDYSGSYFFAPRQLLIYTPMLLLVSSAVYLRAFRTICFRLTQGTIAGVIDGFAVVVLILFSLSALWVPLSGIYSEKKADWRGTARYLLRQVRSDDILVTAGPYIGFYAPELSPQTEEVKDLSSLTEIAQSYRRVWIVGAGGLKRRYPSIFQWIQREDLIELSVDPHIPLYVYSTSLTPDQLLDDLIRSNAYTASTLLSSDFLERAISGGHIEESISIVTQVLNDEELEATDRATIAIRAGRALSDYGEHDKAVDVLVRGISLAPNNSAGWVNLGLVYIRQGREEDAISALQNVLESEPYNYWANHLLARVLYTQGRWQQAIDLEERAAQATRQGDLRAKSLSLAARAYSKLGNITRACEAFHQAYVIRENQEILDEMTRLRCTNEP